MLPTVSSCSVPHHWIVVCLFCNFVKAMYWKLSFPNAFIFAVDCHLPPLVLHFFADVIKNYHYLVLFAFILIHIKWMTKQLLNLHFLSGCHTTAMCALCWRRETLPIGQRTDWVIVCPERAEKGHQRGQAEISAADLGPLHKQQSPQHVEGHYSHNRL